MQVPPDASPATPSGLAAGAGGFAAVVLAGGRAQRLDGADKASVEHRGRTLLEHALDAVADAAEVVVVGDPVATTRPVTFTRETPRYAGPVAALLAGRDALRHAPDTLAVLAVDMPLVTAATFRRLRAAALGHDGAFLTDAAGRRQLAGVLDLARLEEVRPGREHQDGMPLHALLADLDLVLVAPDGAEGHDVDTWADLRELGERTCGTRDPAGRLVAVNLHDWIDELSDVLDVDTEVDEGLVLDLARVAAHNVARPAAPITAYLLGFAAGAGDLDPEQLELLAGRAQRLAESWDRPSNAPDPDDVDDAIPDDSVVDHTGDTFDD